MQNNIPGVSNHSRCCCCYYCCGIITEETGSEKEMKDESRHHQQTHHKKGNVIWVGSVTSDDCVADLVGGGMLDGNKKSGG